MDNGVISRTRTPSGVGGALLAALAAAVAAGGEAAPEAAKSGTLGAEVTALRTLYSPDRPVRLRFMLRNLSDQPVEIPLHVPLDAAAPIALPHEIIFGTLAEPALSVAFENEKPATILPPVAPPAADAPKGTLRLAPHGSLGVDLDLRQYHPALRYKGSYRVEWRPLAGRAGSTSVAFRVEPRMEAILVTDVGRITFTLDYENAPRNVEGFLQLVKNKFYDGKTIHKIIPGFLIQGGCPAGDGRGIRPDGKLLPAEFHDAPFGPGTLAMARKPADPDSASCQFFVTLARVPELDGQYTVIGQAGDEESLRTLHRLASEPTDDNGRPRAALTIRSISLVEDMRASARPIDLKPGRSGEMPPPNPSSPTEEKP